MAQSDLIILTFDKLDDAQVVWRALEMMRERQVFGLEYASAITRNGDGTTILHHRCELPAYPHPANARLHGLLSAAIFAPAAGHDHHHRLTEAGLDEFFLRHVTQALVPDSSAILICMPDDVLSDRRALLDAISLFKCALHRTSIPSDIEQTLLRYIRAH